MADKDQPISVKATSDKVDEHERPPSRHLWVGNVASSVTKEELSEQFSRFGDLENVADYPSRNYAFVNFKSVDDAVYAKKGLHGFVLGGMALRIEFARGVSLLCLGRDLVFCCCSIVSFLQVSDSELIRHRYCIVFSEVVCVFLSSISCSILYTREWEIGISLKWYFPLKEYLEHVF